MAGHAPESPSASRRWLRWVISLSDGRLSLYMLVVAVIIAAVVCGVDRRFME